MGKFYKGLELTQVGSVTNWATLSTSCSWNILGEWKPWHGWQCHCLSRFYRNLLSISVDALIVLQHLFDTYFDNEVYNTILHFPTLWRLPFEDGVHLTLLFLRVKTNSYYSASKIGISRLKDLATSFAFFRSRLTDELKKKIIDLLTWI